MQNIIKKANILIEALPYIRAFRKKVVVIKYGGSILAEDKIRKSVLEDIVFLNFIGLRPVLVHGGGPYISNRMKKIGKKAKFVEGMRVTDKQTLKIVNDELGKLNKKIVNEIKALRADVIGLSGKEDIVGVRKKKNLGFVGKIVRVKHGSISKHLNKDCVVVICPMGIDRNGQIHNINADEVASSVASKLKAEKLVILTNVKGIMYNIKNGSSLISHLTIKRVKSLIKKRVIQQGMIPKVEACLHALNKGVRKTHIVDARTTHALLLEIFTDKGIGSEIIKQ